MSVATAPREAAVTAAPDPSPALRPSYAYYLAFAAVAVNILDAWIFPHAGFDTGGIKFAGLRVTDELCVLALIISLTNLLSGKLQLPRKVGIPLGLATWAWVQGLLVGLQAGHNTRVLFAEWHVLLYFAAISLAWLQAPPALIEKHERILYPLVFIGVLVLLPTSATNKGGDISTIAAGMAAIALIRFRAWVSVPFAILTAALVITGGQRAALLFSLPPMLVAAILAIRERGFSKRAGIATAGGVALLAGYLLYAAGAVNAFLSHESAATFTRTGKIQSAASRREQWNIAIDQIKEVPGFGRGLAYQYQLFDPSVNKIAYTDITHNIYLDIVLRLGFVGAAIIAAILIIGVVKTYRVREHLTSLHITLILILIGLLAKGAVESILDKPRLAVFAAWVTATLLVIPIRQQRRRAAPVEIPPS